MALRKPTKTRSIAVTLPGGEEVEVTARKRKGTRRMTLRFQPLEGGIVLTLPHHASFQEGEKFARSRAGWIAEHIRLGGAPVPFADGASVPVLGEVLAVRHVSEKRGVVQRVEDELHVFGGEEFLPRRLKDWLKKLAKEESERRAHHYLTLLPGDHVRTEKIRVSVREMTSQWGSCHHSGALVFSWRLVLAPVEVLDYVVCHEVAHLVEMSHNRRFWDLVREMKPGFKLHRDWLQQHGHTLFRYGQEG